MGIWLEILDPDRIWRDSPPDIFFDDYTNFGRNTFPRLIEELYSSSALQFQYDQGIVIPAECLRKLSSEQIEGILNTVDEDYRGNAYSILTLAIEEGYNLFIQEFHLGDVWIWSEEYFSEAGNMFVEWLDCTTEDKVFALVKWGEALYIRPVNWADDAGGAKDIIAKKSLRELIKLYNTYKKEERKWVIT